MSEIIKNSNNANSEREPIVVSLEGDSGGETVVQNFDRVFENFSNAHGKGRRRRQARKLARIARKRERRAARLAMRREKMMAKAQMRADRRALRHKDDEEDVGTGGTGAELPQEDMAMDAPTESEYAAPSDSEVPAQDFNDTAQEEEAVDEETDAVDEGSGFTGSSGVDGKAACSEADAKWDDYFSSAEGAAKISPKVMDLNRKIEKNKESAKSIKRGIFAIIKNAGGEKLSPEAAEKAKHLQGNLSVVNKRIAALEEKFAAYTNADGASDDVTMDRIARRRAEVRKAKTSARGERKLFIRKKRQSRIKELVGKNLSSGMSRSEALHAARTQAMQESPYAITHVGGELNAKFSPNRIEVDAEEQKAFNGTGLIGVDNYADVDAPSIRAYDLQFSNFLGADNKTWGHILIGLGLGVVGIWAYHRFKKKS